MSEQPPLEIIERSVRALHAEGASQVEIARRLGVTRWCVRTTAARLGLTWDTSQTVAATLAAVAHARRDRAELALRWLDTAGDELDDADAADTPEERRHHVVNAGISTDKAALLLSHGLDSVNEEAAEVNARADLAALIDAVAGSVD